MSSRLRITSMSLVVLCSSVAGACGEPPPATASGGPAFEARQVELELPTTGGQLVVRAARLTIVDGGAELTLEGDASVRHEGAGGFSAAARRIEVRTADQRVALSGGVRARLQIEGATDGGI